MVTSPASTPAPLFIAGPTAVGKSAVALAVAQALGGEIISVDSMQVYRGLDIGTAKPSLEERRCVPHHLIDVAELTVEYDAARFVQEARAAQQQIQSRGRVPIFCGGTGLYFKAFIEGLGEAPARDDKVRAELESTTMPLLLAELAERDPVTFEKIDRQNPRRVVRALEVIRLTNRPFSEQRAAWNAAAAPVACAFGLSRAADDLQERIRRRVDEMFVAGLVAETAGLLERGLAQNRVAMQALGYRQVVEHLRGDSSLPDTIELVKIRTRQFAKRQLTWFRRQMNLEWIELGKGASPDAIAERIVQRYRIC